MAPRRSTCGWRPTAWSSRTAGRAWRRSSCRACSSASPAATSPAARARPARASASRSPRPTTAPPAASSATRRPSRAARASRCRYRQLEAEARAFAFARVAPDGAVHPPHQLPRDVEPQAGAAHAARQVRVDAVELVEDPPLLARRDAEPVVDHAEADRVVTPGDLQLDRPAVVRVLDRVVDEVRQDLADLVRVAENR